MRNLIVAACIAVIQFGVARAEDPLPSWHDRSSKAAIIDFVTRVTNQAGPDFVAPEARIATFDNDGTLWSEQPLYFQLRFALDRVKALAPAHPEWKDQEPFKSVLANDVDAVLAAGKKGLLQIIAATHAGMTEAKFRETVLAWIKTARHPRFGQPYDALVYQPMLEVLDYLRDNGFKTYITSGGGIAFMRPWAPRAYGIPPEQIIGSSIKTKLELRDGKPVLVRLPEIDFIDDKAEKPVGINKFIGRRPIAAFGNSDGDHQMLQWTMAGEGARFALIVRHTDEIREWDYDRDSHIGRLDKALDEALAKGWTVVDMKKDWKIIYPFQMP
jgi:hypothetical protein